MIDVQGLSMHFFHCGSDDAHCRRTVQKLVCSMPIFFTALAVGVLHVELTAQCGTSVAFQHSVGSQGIISRHEDETV